MKKFIAVCVLLCASALFSQEPAESGSEEKQVEKNAERKKPRNGEIVVTATKSEINKKETGASITIITGEEIEQRGRRNVADIIEDAAGISVSRNSSLGGATSVFIRGTNSSSLAVLIDGVKVNDPTSPNRGFDWGYLSADNIERIEIIRGSQSTLYGSDAIGGVINIITKKGSGAPKVTIKGEIGSFGTFKELLSANGNDDLANYSFALSRIDSSGFSKAASSSSNNSNLEKDPYHNTTFSSRIGVKTVRDSELFFAVRYIDANVLIDGGAYKDERGHYNQTEVMSSVLGYSIPICSWWEANLLLNYMNIARKDVTTSISDLWYHGKNQKAELRNKINILGYDEITFGAEAEKENATTTGFLDRAGGVAYEGIDKSQYSKALYAQNHLKLFKRIFFIAGIRHTDPQNFESNNTYSLSTSIIVPITETRLKGNYGSGFKVPSLYQFYDSSSGNQNLKPEKSVSRDVGIEQPLYNDLLVFEVNYFVIDYMNMIDYSNSTYKYYNVEKAKISGYEFILKFKPSGDLKIDAMYSITYTKNYETDSELIYRPKYRGSINVDYSFLKDGNINLGFIYVGKRLDYVYPSTFPPKYSYVDPYYTFNLAASYWVIPELQIFGRIENLMNKKYEDVRGYQTPLRSYYAGAKAVF